MNMKKKTAWQIVFFVFILTVLASSQVFADSLTMTSYPTQWAGGYGVGAWKGRLNGGTTANYYCVDFSGTTYIYSPFNVIVSSLSDLTNTKFYDKKDPALSLKQYQQVGWLMYEMQINPTQVASIQYAMWSIFTPSTPTYGDSAYWLDASTKINPNDYDFSKMRVYTPTGSKNQEFIGGGVTALTPEPAEWVLLIMGLGLMTYFYNARNRRQAFVRVAR